VRTFVYPIVLWSLLSLLSACRHRAPATLPEKAEIDTTLFLIGDAGEASPRGDDAVLDSLAAQASVAPERTLVVFLGDNVYPYGMPREGAAEWADSRRRLAAQVMAVPPGARAVFIPGNEDWSNEGPFGLYAIRLQEQVLTSLAAGRNVQMLPGNGCPGPVSVDAGRLRVITLDTQWWLHDYIVRDSSSNCPENVAAVMQALREQLRPTMEHQIVIVAAHHPLITGGEHGGYCGIAGPFRLFAGRSQDIPSGSNRMLRDSLESAFSEHAPLAYAAGHDHNLQVLRGGRHVGYVLVSGAGSYAKTKCAVKLRESYYTSQHRSGFMRLDILKERGALLRVYRYTSAGVGGLAYSRWLEPR
jgi:hypothetical protein